MKNGSSPVRESLLDEPAEKRDDIFIKGARTHNLKNIDVTFPRGKLIVVTGVSGSGKSSLAFDTLYAEGHRRYVESMSSYLRQFLERMPKPDIDYIKGIAPAIAIEQKTISKNPRSTVGTVTEIYDYLRLLFARIGKTYSPETNELVQKHTTEDVLLQVSLFPEGAKCFVTFPLPKHHDEKDKQRTFEEEVQTLKQKGFYRLLGSIESGNLLYDLSQPEEEKKVRALSKSAQSRLMVLTDRIVLKHNDEAISRLSEAVEAAFRESNGYCTLRIDAEGGYRDLHFSDKFELAGVEYEEPSPQLFAFNSPVGACTVCQGFGRVPGIDEDAVIPNKALSLRENAIVAWNGERHTKHFFNLVKIAPKYKIDLTLPYSMLPKEAKQMIWEGVPKEGFQGLHRFFKDIERESLHKMHYRVFLNRFRGYTVCPECGGSRLKKAALNVKVSGKSIFDIVQMPISDAISFFNSLTISPFDREIAKTILVEIQRRLNYLSEVGLHYLTLDRPANTLSGGESQRINLATSLGSSLVGSVYILDEPSIGLHQQDSSRLIRILKQLRDIGNTVIVVEHDREIMEAADIIIDLGPKAGRLGGELIFHGTYPEILQHPKSLTGRYLNDIHEIKTPVKRRAIKWSHAIEVEGALENNLKNLTVKFPLGVMTCVTGVSGSGKSTLVGDILHLGLLKEKVGTSERVGTHKAIRGGNLVSKVELVDQSPIGRTSRSNSATYLKIFDDIRALFASTPVAKLKGWDAGYFSFNIPGGRCETCAGEGVVHVEMQFLADLDIPCEACGGRRYKVETCDAVFNSKSIADVLEMTISEAVAFFKEQKSISKKLHLLEEVGLGYLQLGQSGSTLSGGEAQRLKLAYHIASNESKDALFIFDEPTTGLHFDDIQKLLGCFQRLIAQGNSLIIIEHNLDVIKQADWIIDLGPEAGTGGGELVAVGTPEEVAKSKVSRTGRYLRQYLS